MNRDVVELIESAYDLRSDGERWLSSLARRAAKLVPDSLGAMVYEFDASAPSEGVRIKRWSSAAVPEDFVAGTLELNRTTQPIDAHRFYHRGILCGTVSEQLSAAGIQITESFTYSRAVGRRGYPDTFGLTASSPTFRGIVINSPMREPRTLDRRLVQLWRQIGVHLQAGCRLREALVQRPRDGEALVSPEGDVIHAEGSAMSSAALKQLRDSVLRVERVRRRAGDVNAMEGLEFWQGLVAGRWSLVEQFESDGKRYFVAYANPYTDVDSRALTQRERDIAALSAQGDSSKWIAYQLGISPSTVAKHLKNAVRKLGLRSRLDLIWIYNKLQ